MVTKISEKSYVISRVIRRILVSVYFDTFMFSPSFSLRILSNSEQMLTFSPILEQFGEPEGPPGCPGAAFITIYFSKGALASIPCVCECSWS